MYHKYRSDRYPATQFVTESFSTQRTSFNSFVPKTPHRQNYSTFKYHEYSPVQRLRQKQKLATFASSADVFGYRKKSLPKETATRSTYQYEVTNLRTQYYGSTRYRASPAKSDQKWRSFSRNPQQNRSHSKQKRQHSKSSYRSTYDASKIAWLSLKNIFDFKQREFKVHTLNQLNLLSAGKQARQQAMKSLGQLMVFKQLQLKSRVINNLRLKLSYSKHSSIGLARGLQFGISLKSIFDGNKKAAFGRLMHNLRSRSKREMIVESMTSALQQLMRNKRQLNKRQLYNISIRRKERLKKLIIFMQVAAGAVARKKRYYTKLAFNSLESMVRYQYSVQTVQRVQHQTAPLSKPLPVYEFIQGVKPATNSTTNKQIYALGNKQVKEQQLKVDRLKCQHFELHIYESHLNLLPLSQPFQLWEEFQNSRIDQSQINSFRLRISNHEEMQRPMASSLKVLSSLQQEFYPPVKIHSSVRMRVINQDDIQPQLIGSQKMRMSGFDQNPEPINMKQSGFKVGYSSLQESYKPRNLDGSGIKLDSLEDTFKPINLHSSGYRLRNLEEEYRPLHSSGFNLNIREQQQKPMHSSGYKLNRHQEQYRPMHSSGFNAVIRNREQYKPMHSSGFDTRVVRHQHPYKSTQSGGYNTGAIRQIQTYMPTSMHVSGYKAAFVPRQQTFNPVVMQNTGYAPYRESHLPMSLYASGYNQINRQEKYHPMNSYTSGHRQVYTTTREIQQPMTLQASRSCKNISPEKGEGVKTLGLHKVSAERKNTVNEGFGVSQFSLGPAVEPYNQPRSPPHSSFLDMLDSSHQLWDQAITRHPQPPKHSNRLDVRKVTRQGRI